MNTNSETNPYREAADQRLVVTTRKMLAARAKYLSKYDVKITIQERIVFDLGYRLSGPCDLQAPGKHKTLRQAALVANTLPIGAIHVDSLKKDLADTMAAFDVLDLATTSEQFDALMAQQRNLDKYEESIKLREWAAATLLQNLNKEATSKASGSSATAAKPGNSASESTTPTDPSSPK